MLFVDMASSVDTEFDVPQLILEVKNRPALYDTSLPEYHDRNLKKRLWHEVCRELYSDSVWDGLKYNEQTKIEKDIQNRWNSLRGCFRRDLRDLNAQKKSPTPKKKRKYIYFDSLLFLLPFTEAANSDLCIELENEEQSSKKDTETEGSLEKKTKLKPMKKNVDEEMIKILKEGVQMLTKKNEDDEDDDEAFLRSLLPSIKQFTQDQKLMLRIEIIKTILQFKQSQNNEAKSLGT